MKKVNFKILTLFLSLGFILNSLSFVEAMSEEERWLVTPIREEVIKPEEEEEIEEPTEEKVEEEESWFTEPIEEKEKEPEVEEAEEEIEESTEEKVEEKEKKISDGIETYKGDFSKIFEFIKRGKLKLAKKLWQELRIKLWLYAKYREIVGKEIVNYQDERGTSALHYAAVSGDVDLVNSLIRAGANVNATTFGSKNIPLHFATNPGIAGGKFNPQIIKALIKAGADTQAKRTDRKTPLEFAPSQYKEQIKKIIQKDIFNLVKTKRTEEIVLAKKILEQFLKRPNIFDKKIVNYQDKRGTSALHYAAASGDLELVKLLIQAGANVNATTFGSKNTPLHFATKPTVVGKGGVLNLEIIKALIGAGADTKAKRTDGKTPLGFALRRDKAKIQQVIEESE